jgi:hypothetical protein
LSSARSRIRRCASSLITPVGGRGEVMPCESRDLPALLTRRGGDVPVARGGGVVARLTGALQEPKGE